MGQVLLASYADNRDVILINMNSFRSNKMRVSRLILMVLTLSCILSGASAPLAKAVQDTDDCVSSGYTLPWMGEAVLRVEA